MILGMAGGAWNIRGLNGASICVGGLDASTCHSAPSPPPASLVPAPSLVSDCRYTC